MCEKGRYDGHNNNNIWRRQGGLRSSRIQNHSALLDYVVLCSTSWHALEPQYMNLSIIARITLHSMYV